MADYRRELNKQCNDCDYVIWGESSFTYKTNIWNTRQLKHYLNEDGINRFVATFGIRKCGTIVGKY